VGAPGENSAAKDIDGDQKNEPAESSGAVYTFRATDSKFAQEAYVKASNTGGRDAFGAALALSADGETLLVGAFGEDSGATGVNGDQTNDQETESGAAYLLRRPR
jgi:trimeric autotransporter adhesin